MRLGEAALDLDGEHGLLHLALPAPVGREEKIAGQLHGQRRGALHLASGADVAEGGADDAEKVDARVGVEILVFNRDERVAEHRRKVVVAGDYAALQGERSDDAALIVVKLSDGTGTVRLERVDLRKVGGVDEQQTGGGSDEDGNEDEEAEQDAADQLAAADFHFRKVIVEGFHAPQSQDSTLKLLGLSVRIWRRGRHHDSRWDAGAALSKARCCLPLLICWCRAFLLLWLRTDVCGGLGSAEENCGSRIQDGGEDSQGFQSEPE